MGDILSQMYYGRDVKYVLFCEILKKLEFSGQFFFFEKYSNIKFHKNPSNGRELFHEFRRKTNGRNVSDSRFSYYREPA